MMGTAGTTVYISYAEKLNSNGDGTIDNERQTDSYALKGGGPEPFQPQYGWKGYRYIEVSTSSNPDSSSNTPLPTILSARGVVVHTALPSSGDFNSSSDLLNRMHAAMRNTILNNQYSYGSDTPVYEKGGLDQRQR